MGAGPGTEVIHEPVGLAIEHEDRDTAGLRVGDCVAVERGTFNNLRMAPDERCDTAGPVPESARAESEACIQAKQQLIDAANDEEFDRAERRVRLLCDH